MAEVVFEGKSYKDIDKHSQSVFHAMNIHTFRFFPKDRIWMASDATAEKFGVDKFYKVEGYNDGPNIVYDGDRDKDHEMYKEIMSGKNTTSKELRSYDGESYYKVTLAVLERDSEGTPVVVAGVIEDYDEQMIQSALTQMLAGDYTSVYHVDFEKGQVTPYRMADFIENKYGEQLSQKPTYEAIMSKYIEQEVIEEERDEMHMITSHDNIEKQLQSQSVFFHDFRVLRDGKPVYIRYKAVKINEGDKLTRMVAGFADVSRDKQDKLERLAFFDQVTLGNNYNYYSETLKGVKCKGFIISLDIRDFKIINDARGIAKGDEILQKVSAIIEQNLCENGFFGHVNADHFVMFVPTEDEKCVIEVINNITKSFEELVEKEEIPKISPYFGVSRWIPGDRIQVMFSQANSAKHRIKDRTDTNYGFYRDEDNEAELEIKRIEDSFEGAIKNEQFEVWYQPKYSPVERELTGAEALVRWRGPDGNLVSPGKFIPVYEKNGMIRQLDEYVFVHVCKQQKKWLETLGKTVPVSINLSRASLFYENIVEEYKAIAENIGISPELVPIEITESAAISNSDIKSLADRFYEAGFPLHIDDFGTGYSSLSTLNLMKFDTLKLDKSLIDYIGEFGGDRLIKHTVALAKDLGLHVTAEGVEQDEQVVFLKEVECDNIQGFIYSRPIMKDNFEEKLKEDTISIKYLYTN